jgi:preprotein translocase subunit Sss1
MYGRTPRNTVRGFSRVMRYYHRPTKEEKEFNAVVFTVPNAIGMMVVGTMCILNPLNFLVLIPIVVGVYIAKKRRNG